MENNNFFVVKTPILSENREWSLGDEVKINFKLKIIHIKGQFYPLNEQWTFKDNFNNICLFETEKKAVSIINNLNPLKYKDVDYIGIVGTNNLLKIPNIRKENSVSTISEEQLRFDSYFRTNLVLPYSYNEFDFIRQMGFDSFKNELKLMSEKKSQMSSAKRISLKNFENIINKMK